MALNFLRKIGSLSYQSAGQRSRLDLPRTALYKRLILQLYGTFDQTTGAGTLLATNCEGLVRDFSVVANGSTVLKSFDGHMLKESNRLDHLTYGPRVAIANIAADSEIQASWAIDFAMPRSVRPIDTALDSAKWGTLQLVVTWGDISDIASGSSGTFVFTDLVLDVYVEELTGLEGNFGLSIESQMRQSYSAVSGEQDTELPTGDFLRSITLRTLGSTGDTSNAIVSRVSLISGATRFVDDLGWGNTAAAAFATGGLEVQNANLFGFTPPTGIRRLDFAPDGLLTEALNTAALRGELKLRMNLGTSSVTGTLGILLCQIANPSFVRA